MIKDIAKSIKAKLLNLAQKEQLDYQLLVIRYLYERLLYRLSISGYREKLYLKGGALLYAFEKDNDLSFETVMILITARLEPIYESLKEGNQ